MNTAETTSITEILCQSANEFLAYLLPTHPMWEDQQCKWIFRGQSNASWKLVPSLFRKESWELFKSIDPSQLTVGELIQNEYWVFKNFVETCDIIGLSLHEDSQITRTGYLRYKAENLDLENVKGWSENWPPTLLLSLIAAAQHHGIPTRLLDWTRSSLIACYFAAKGGAKTFFQATQQLDQKIIVFALNSSRLYSDIGTFKKPSGLYLISAPYGSNGYLSAQKGLFTLFREIPKFFDQVSIIPLDEFIEKSEHLMIKFTLPIDNCPELLRKLSDFGISAASIYPGLSGVTEALKEKCLFDKRF